MSGQDITTEAYPYSAGQTSIDSALFDDWESYPDEQFETYQWPATGERLTRETFAKYRAQGGSVIIHNRTEEMTRTAIASPLTMIASDGSLTHPRGSGTYAKVLGKYVREEGLVELMDALRAHDDLAGATLGAIRARDDEQGSHPRRQRRRHHRLRPRHRDRQAPRIRTPRWHPTGIPYVLVNGVLVVDGGELVSGARAGEPIRR